MSLPIVEVRWFDAWIDTGDICIKKARKSKPIERFTIGYLIEEGEDGLVLSTDYFPNKKKRVKEISARMVIPWGMIDYWEIQDV